jgi:cysteine sulfinate desulfinase/cysteine desulfurase-like protein
LVADRSRADEPVRLLVALSLSLTIAGTENVLLAVGMGEASRVTMEEFPDLMTHLLRLRLLLVSLLNDAFQVSASLASPLALRLS